MGYILYEHFHRIAQDNTAQDKDKVSEEWLTSDHQPAGKR